MVVWALCVIVAGWGSLTNALNSKLVYMAYQFILLRLNLFDLWVDKKGWEFERSVLYLQVCLSAEGAKKFPGPGYLRSKDRVVWLWHLLVNLCMYMTIHIYLIYIFYYILYLPKYIHISYKLKLKWLVSSRTWNFSPPFEQNSAKFSVFKEETERES